LKILLASNYFYPEHLGGTETVLHNLGREYRAAGHEVRWLAADCGESPHRAPGDVPLTALNVIEQRTSLPYPLPAPWTIRRMVAAVRWCDVLHIHDCLYIANIILFALSRWIGKPVLLTQHIGMIPYRRRLLRWMLMGAYRTVGGWLLSRAERVTFVGPVVMDWFTARVSFAAMPTLISNGVDPKLFAPASPGERAEIRRRRGIAPDQPVLLFVGRFVEKKGIHLLRPLAERCPDWLWLFVGRSFGSSPADWGLPNVRVLRPVPQDDLRDLYVAADVLVLPSMGEGLPMAVLESLACGTPVLTTEETATNSGQVSALLSASAPTSEAIGAAVAQILAAALPERKQAIATEAARRWGWGAVAGEYLAILEALAGAAQPVKGRRRSEIGLIDTPTGRLP
jgi:glycosyltransferase involved in cell wall biosynthesis